MLGLLAGEAATPSERAAAVEAVVSALSAFGAGAFDACPPGGAAPESAFSVALAGSWALRRLTAQRDGAICLAAQRRGHRLEVQRVLSLLTQQPADGEAAAACCGHLEAALQAAADATADSLGVMGHPLEGAVAPKKCFCFR